MNTRLSPLLNEELLLQGAPITFKQKKTPAAKLALVVNKEESVLTQKEQETCDHATD